MTTFAEQSTEYMRGLRLSRDPARPTTLKRYQSYLDAHLLPQVGSRQLTDLGNAAAKGFFDPISARLSASTIRGIFNVFKGVIASAVDANGDQIHPRAWNTGFLDFPKLSPDEQNTPEVSIKSLEQAISGGSHEDRLLWAFLAGSGLRIGEALAVQTTPGGTGNYWDRAAATVTVENQWHQEGYLGPVKTPAGRRIVDLCRPLNDMLVKIAPETGFAFDTTQTAARKRLNKQIPDTGFHAFRRFRLTQLAVKGTPTELNYFWSGHAADDIHQRYAKWVSREAERREWTERVGLGFELPLSVPEILGGEIK